jgi:hypothetical protein
MEMPAQTEKLWGIDGETQIPIHTGSDESEVTVGKGEKVEKYSEFDIKIRLTSESHPDDYTPSHPHVFRDLDMKIKSDSESGQRLFGIIQQVFEGRSPSNFIDELEGLTFENEKFPSDVTVCLLQLMMIEQEINFGPGGRTTHYHPPRDLLMSCVRWIHSGEYDDIGDIISAAYNGRVDEKYQWDGESIWTRPNYHK